MDLRDATRLGNSMTNEVYLKDNQIIRVFGAQSEQLIDREREEEIMRLVGAAGLGPKVIDTFSDRRVEEYLHPSITLTNEQLYTPTVLKRIATRLKKFHSLATGTEAILEKRLKHWSELAGIPLPSDLLEGVNTNNIVLAHNDLVCCNILSCDGEICFIDMEYAGFNYCEFDLANMFCEMELDQETQKGTLPEDVLKIVRTLERQFCVWYTGDIITGKQLYHDVCKYKPIVHYLWMLWSKVKGYPEYQEMRMRMYNKYK
jgi:thiamine kinase-like enzyme